MTKNFLTQKKSKTKFLSCFLVLCAFMTSMCAQAQTNCQFTAGISANGTTTANGVQISSSSIGSVQSVGTSPFIRACISGINTIATGGGVRVGVNDSWVISFTFDKPVNDLIFVIAEADGNENYIFNSNGGGVSISSDSSCGMLISGNGILTNGGGGGYYKIHSSIPYTQLTVNGARGNGSLLGICFTSINFLGVQDTNAIKNEAVDIYPTQVKDVLTISSKEALKSYKIFDESGKLVSTSTLEGNKTDINLSGIITGCYIIAVETKTQTINKKIVKK
ncbi:T9SS type A sorting domain-containing protein [Chryseobacterium nematophagum]|nr:T9SS type A sorting domain-containing protein [Chryseobacterium nematophagum]